jgi:hypothetical protein
MKLTKQQLITVIKEELNIVLSEYTAPRSLGTIDTAAPAPTHQKAAKKTAPTIEEAIQEELYNVLAEIEEQSPKGGIDRGEALNRTTMKYEPGEKYERGNKAYWDAKQSPKGGIDRGEALNRTTMKYEPGEKYERGNKAYWDAKQSPTKKTGGRDTRQKERTTLEKDRREGAAAKGKNAPAYGDSDSSSRDSGAPVKKEGLDRTLAEKMIQEVLYNVLAEIEEQTLITKGYGDTESPKTHSGRPRQVKQPEEYKINADPGSGAQTAAEQEKRVSTGTANQPPAGHALQEGWTP